MAGSASQNIRAIETVYRGYRFRSRLEARWAVFFEEYGLRWEYEREGYDLDGVWYLPDFWLPEENLHVEVKPGPAPKQRTPRVYMAGRMGHPTKPGQFGETTCYRPFSVALDAQDVGLDGLIDPITKELCGTIISYTGPFNTGNGDHSAVHGELDDWSGAEGRCFLRAMHGIRNAQLVFAYLEDLKAFGTLAEIGYAYGLGKHIVIGLGGDFDAAISQSIDHGAYAHAKHAATDRHNELWFACKMAREVLIGTKNDVFDKLSDIIRANYPMPREINLAHRLALQTRAGASVVYGDPVEAFETGGVFELSFGRADSFFNEAARDRRAALTARQARFEHGQSGAR